MRSFKERVGPIPLPSRYSWEGVGDYELRESIQAVEQRAISHAVFPIRLRRAVFLVGEAIKMENARVWDLIDIAHTRGIIPFISEPHGKKNYPVLDKDGLLALAAICHTYKKLLYVDGRCPSRLTRKDVQDTVFKTRKVLGLHPLAEKIHDPNYQEGSRAVVSPPQPPSAPSQQKREKPKTPPVIEEGDEDLLAAAEARADAFLGIRSFAEKIPPMDPEELTELRKWGPDKLIELFNSLPVNDEKVDFAQRPGLYAVAKAIVFIHGANEHALGRSKLGIFDPSLKNLTLENLMNCELREATGAPYGYMRKFPEIFPHLGAAFQKIAKQIREGNI